MQSNRLAPIPTTAVYDQIQAGLDHAIASVRHTPTTLRVGFGGAAAGQVVQQTGDLFPERVPDCRIHAREAQVIDAVARLRAGDVDVLVLSLWRPDTEPGAPGLPRANDLGRAGIPDGALAAPSA